MFWTSLHMGSALKLKYCDNENYKLIDKNYSKALFYSIYHLHSDMYTRHALQA